jgi:hypothetical protein
MRPTRGASTQTAIVGLGRPENSVARDLPAYLLPVWTRQGLEDRRFLKCQNDPSDEG